MSNSEIIKISARGIAVLNNPLINKGTAFTQNERDELQLNGLLPIHVSSVEEQIQRNYESFSRKRTPIGKYEFLLGLSSRNELLFYQVIQRFASEMLPIIYTPTVGEAALRYSRIFFHHRGLYLSYPLKDKMDSLFQNYPQKEIDVIVVTDGERVLGLGDQGIGGMTIPVGKLSLYTLFGGVHPAKTLPILLDVGTNNEELLNDPLYIGWRHKRLQGEEYDAFISEFIARVKKQYPNALLQWEDFGKNNARRLLDLYKDQLLSFNDDIQGTASVALAAILGALNVSGQKLVDQKIAILGGGSAGTGIADTLVNALVDEGLSPQEAASSIYIVDREGLIHFNSAHVTEGQRPYIQSQAAIKDWQIRNPEHISLYDVVYNAHPTILIGVSAQAGAFTKEVIEEMMRRTERPIVLPLSNPTSKAECTPDELIEWTEGKAIIATGSPFKPVLFQGRVYHVGQCNNIYIFPGIGLGALASGARKVTDGMFLAAARTLASHSPAMQDVTASLFPPIEQVRGVTREIALAVGKKAIEEGVARVELADLEKAIEARMWEPHYPIYSASALST
jgi:malate dehydrogenase (oxaloacetate-decarboxylating)